MLRPTALAVLLLAGVVGCQSAPTAGPVSSATTTTTTTPVPTPVEPTPTTTEPPPASTVEPTTAAPPALAGKTVVLDPGHNGANASHPAEINKQVPNGDGGTKACNTVGTSTMAGYPEHAFTWAVAVAVSDLLTQKGATVVLTRSDDNGVGPCVDQRASIGNDAAADAVVSIHADGASTGSSGFHCILTGLAPGGQTVSAESALLAADVRDALAAGPLSVANYAGSDGIHAGRTDLAGLNLSNRPTTLCELGNMKSPTDSALQESPDGRAAIAAAIADGITSYLTG